MKNRTTTLRLSDEEYKKLEHDAACAKMTSSQYIRSLINEITPTAESHQQEIVSILCRLYIHLSERGLNEDESLMEEMNRICRTLF